EGAPDPRTKGVPPDAEPKVQPVPKPTPAEVPPNPKPMTPEPVKPEPKPPEPKPETKEPPPPAPKPEPRPTRKSAKAAVPHAAAQARAEEEIKDLFKEEYAKRKRADMAALAKTFWRRGLETKDDAAARFVLWREAADLAARAGDLDTAV